MATVAVLAMASTTGLSAVAIPAHAKDLKQRIESVKQRVNALDAKAEAASERYNAARIHLAAAQQKAESAQRAFAKSERTLKALQQSVSAFAVAAYQGQTAASALTMTADSPQAYVDEVSTLQAVSSNQSQTINDLAAARRAEEQARANAHAALAEQRATTQQMQADRNEVLATAHQEQQLLAKMQKREQEIVAAAKARAERIAAQQAAAALAARQAAAAAAAAALQAQPATPQVVHTAPTGSGGAATAVRWAYAEIGKPYVWGAAGPNSFDCSGLTQYVWGKAGVYLDHYTGSQWNEGMHVTRDQLQPGDLVFFYSDLHHVGIYVGGGKFIQAPHTGAYVELTPLAGYYSENYAGAVRPGA